MLVEHFDAGRQAGCWLIAKTSNLYENIPYAGQELSRSTSQAVLFNVLSYIARIIIAEQFL